MGVSPPPGKIRQDNWLNPVTELTWRGPKPDKIPLLKNATVKKKPKLEFVNISFTIIALFASCCLPNDQNLVQQGQAQAEVCKSGEFSEAARHNLQS